MGIPLFFKFLCKKYPKCIIDLPFFLQHNYIDDLYFDLNGLIHPACSNVKKTADCNEIDKVEIEKRVIDETRKEITKVIELTKPKKYVNLSVDGVAPFAKMNQQRGRRYKSYLVNKKIQALNKKYNISTLDWDTNMISPGTPFMNKLMIDLDKFTKILNKNYNVNVELSSSNVKGEGEQKIIHKIRQTRDEIKNKIIFGLDADLIMLSLISGVDNIFLLRESRVFGVEGSEYLILDINELRDAIFKEVKETYENLSDKLSFKRENIIVDYITLCFLVGNDFLPNLTMLSIDKGAINYLLKIYTQILYKYNKHLVSDKKINWDILLEILEIMSRDEDNFVKLYHHNYVKKRYFEPNHLSEYEKKLRKLEYSPLINNVPNTVEFHKKNWEQRYYNRYLKVQHIRQKDLDKIVLSYLKGLQWTLDYYQDQCPCWGWYYSYTCSPTVKDIYNYLKINSNLEIQFQEHCALEPIKQLLCILPRKSLENIPNTLQYINDLEYLYPSKFQLDTLYKVYHHQCSVYLPMVDYDYIKDYEL